MSLSSEAKKHLHESLQQQCLNQKLAEYNEAKKLFTEVTLKDYGHTSSSDRNDIALLDTYYSKKITREDLLSRILVACADALSLIPEYIPFLNSFALASSSNTEKYSWHIIYSHAQFVDYRELNRFTEKIIELVGKPYSKFIDISFSKTHFNLRLLESAKEDHIKRPAISSAKENYSIIRLRTFSSKKQLQIGRIKKEFINFQVQSVKECPICNIKHKKDRLYEFIQKNRHFVFKCNRQKQYKPEHNSISFNKISDKVESKEKPKLELNKRIVKAVLNPYLFFELSEKVINVKEMKDFPEAYSNFLSKEPSITLICSPIMSEKTKDEQSLSIDKWNVIIVQVKSLSCIEFSACLIVAILDEVNAIQHQMNSSLNVQESKNTIRDILRSAQHVLAMNAFANESKTVEYLYDPNSRAKAMRIGFKYLKQGKHMRILSLYYQKISSEFSHSSGYENIRAELAIAQPNDLPIAIKRHRELDIDSISINLINLILLIASTRASLKLIKMDKNKEIIGNHKKVHNEIKAEALVIKNTDFDAVATSRNLTSEKAKFLKLNSKCSVADTIVLNPLKPRKHFLCLSYFYKQGYDKESAIKELKAKDIT
ncbi:3611_t:CDS:10 [Scutellospora calospora]|uniref:3611_t:CDS:1 n=1 Tax=Scutellospora calospora TaxID=85575 RepID=A0ACA9KF24_9GLOM|nr:3611_t:CDS:10 [Scutellospora calospora]